MNRYRDYMDRQQVSVGLHDRLMTLESQPVQTARPRRWPKAAALVACCALIVGVGLWQSTPTQPTPTPGVTDTAAPGQIFPVTDSSGAGDQINAADLRGFVADSGEGGKMMFPMIPAISYPDLTESPADVSVASLKIPDGAFSVELTEEQVCLILWGSQDALNQAHIKEKPGNVPWMLFWDGFTIAGRAWYDGSGDLWQVFLWGCHEDEREFSITLAPGKLPPTCVVRGGAGISDCNGVEVEAWTARYDRDGDGRQEHAYDSAFVANGIGVRAQFIIPDDTSVGQLDGEPQYDLLSNLFIRWACTSPGLTLDHLLVNEDIPAWRSVSLRNLAEARQETEFAPYLPQSGFAGYGEFAGHLTYQEGTTNHLWVRWSRGYDDIEVSVILPEGGIPDYRPVDASDPAGYDVRLYEIPWCDSVPEEYQTDFYSPTFRAEDMTREIIAARQMDHDTGGSTFHFQVLHPNGVLVEYRCDGLTVDQVWALVEPTLS